MTWKGFILIRLFMTQLRENIVGYYQIREKKIVA